MYASITLASCNELRSLSAPPEDVKKIAGAILALLGVVGTIDVRNEKDPRMWKHFRTSLSKTTGNDALFQRMATFDVKTASDEQVRMARHFMEDLTLARVKKVSLAAASFFLWVHNALQVSGR